MPAAAEGFEHCNLILNQDGAGRRDRRVGGNQGLLARQKVQRAHRASKELVVGHVEGLLGLALSVGQRLTVIQLCAVGRERLFRLLQRLKHGRIEAG